jgi:hypothetical protein
MEFDGYVLKMDHIVLELGKKGMKMRLIDLALTDAEMKLKDSHKPINNSASIKAESLKRVAGKTIL